MSKYQRKPIRNGPVGTIVVGDAPVGAVGVGWRKGSPIQRLAKKRAKKPTRTEKELEKILNGLNNGVLKGKFQREWAFAGKWILDFFFYENRLGIEVDGGYHHSEKQKQKDLEKDNACDKFDITLLRLTNKEIFGDRETLICRLRESYRKANERMRNNTKDT